MLASTHYSDKPIYQNDLSIRLIRPWTGPSYCSPHAWLESQSGLVDSLDLRVSILPHLGLSWSWFVMVSPGMVSSDMGYTVSLCPSKMCIFLEPTKKWFRTRGLKERSAYQWLGLIGAAHRKARNQCKQTHETFCMTRLRYESSAKICCESWAWTLSPFSWPRNVKLPTNPRFSQAKLHTCTAHLINT